VIYGGTHFSPRVSDEKQMSLQIASLALGA
jgi:hypothetical protein